MVGLHIKDRVIECLQVGDLGMLRSAPVETPVVTWSELMMIMSNTFCQVMFVRSVGYVKVYRLHSVTKIFALFFLQLYIERVNIQ